MLKEVNMKRIILIIIAITLSLSLSSCSPKWTREDISKAHTVEITAYDSENPNIKVIYTITDEQAVANLCNTFSILDLKDAHIKETIEKSFYIRFIGNGGEIDHISVIAGHNAIQDKHGDLYKITDEVDIERYVSEVIEIAPSEITRDPEEKYYVDLLKPAQNQTIKSEEEPPVFIWNLKQGFAETFVLEIDYMGDGTYMSRTVEGHLSYQLSADDWKKIKNNVPTINGVKKVQWRIRIDYKYHTELEPYYTGWGYFEIE